MISLRKAMIGQVEDALQSTLASYRDALMAIGTANGRACPPASVRLQGALLALHQRLATEASPSVVSETEKQLETELQNWADEAAGIYHAKTTEVKDILSLLARAAVEVGERDQRYSEQFRQLTERLQATTRLNDLTAIRQSLSRSVIDLESCVSEMNRDGRNYIAQLRAQLTTYEARLEEMALVASLDALTGLFNRRTVEAELERRIRDGCRFSLIYLDLNSFKQINDTFGHVAGDDLLKQFARELRTVCRAKDVVARWGGDEFVVIVDASLYETQLLVARIEKWVAGRYMIALPKPATVKVTASVGFAGWQIGETLSDVIRKADSMMYEHKALIKSLHR